MCIYAYVLIQSTSNFGTQNVLIIFVFLPLAFFWVPVKGKEYSELSCPSFPALPSSFLSPLYRFSQISYKYYSCFLLSLCDLGIKVSNKFEYVL